MSLNVTPTVFTMTGTRQVINASGRVLCSADVTVSTAGGASDDIARWSSASITYKKGSTINVQSLTSSEVAAWFGTDRIAHGQTLTGHIPLSLDSDFLATVSIGYITLTGSGNLPSIAVNCQ
jgi:hypothetical protein